MKIPLSEYGAKWFGHGLFFAFFALVSLLAVAALAACLAVVCQLRGRQADYSSAPATSKAVSETLPGQAAPSPQAFEKCLTASPQGMVVIANESELPRMMPELGEAVTSATDGTAADTPSETQLCINGGIILIRQNGSHSTCISIGQSGSDQTIIFGSTQIMLRDNGRTLIISN